jgi:O-antigen ligase
VNRYRSGYTARDIAWVSLLAGGLLLALVILSGLLALGWYVVLVPLLILTVGSVVTFLWPSVGLLAVIASTYSILPFPPIPVGGGKVFLGDALLPAILCYLAVRERNSLALVWERSRAVLIPVALLLCLAALSAVRARYYLGVSARDVLSESRPFVYWLMLPATLLVCIRERDRKLFFWGLVALGLGLASVFIVQHVTGYQLLRGRVEELETLGQHFSDVTRNVTPGVHLILFVLLFLLAMVVKGRIGAWPLLLPIVVCALALLTTFGRTVWGGSLVCVTAISMFAGVRGALKLSVSAVLLAICMAFAVSSFAPKTATAIQDRVLSVGAEVARGSSYDWRRQENGYAWRALKHEPLLGIGLGQDFKPRTKLTLLPEQTRHLHNGYLYMVLKLGVVAAVIPIWMMVVAFLRTRASLRHGAGTGYESSVAIGAFCAFLYPNAAAFTQPEWMNFVAVASMALFLGLLFHFAGPNRVTQAKGVVEPETDRRVLAHAVWRDPMGA